MPKRRAVRPLKRTNPSGDTVYVARVTDDDGHRHYIGTCKLRREAQDLIDDYYDRQQAPANGETVGTYFAGWLDRHPRAERTDVSYDGRIRAVLDVKLDGRKLRDWPLPDVQRRQAVDLLDHMLREQGRAVNGARGILRVLSAMWQDAIDDGHPVTNPFMGLRIRQHDRRVRKPQRKIQTWSWEQMHEFAAACGPWEPMVRVLSDCGLRIGELFPLERGDVFLDGECGDPDCWFHAKGIVKPHLHVRRTSWRRKVESGTKTDHGSPYAGRETPLAAVLAGMLDGMPKRIDTRLLFPGPLGLWDRDFYRDVWEPARDETGLSITPHEMRHSYVSRMRAAGVDPSDLAYWTGHTVATATARYTHSTGGSVDVALEAVTG